MSVNFYQITALFWVSLKDVIPARNYGSFRLFCKKIPPEFAESLTFFCFSCFLNFFCKYMSDQSQKQQIMLLFAENYRMVYKLSCKKVKKTLIFVYCIKKSFFSIFLHDNSKEKIQKTWKTQKSSAFYGLS